MNKKPTIEWNNCKQCQEDILAATSNSSSILVSEEFFVALILLWLPVNKDSKLYLLVAHFFVLGSNLISNSQYYLLVTQLKLIQTWVIMCLYVCKQIIRLTFLLLLSPVD